MKLRNESLFKKSVDIIYTIQYAISEVVSICKHCVTQFKVLNNIFQPYIYSNNLKRILYRLYIYELLNRTSS